jgi:hypothetical protein
MQASSIPYRGVMKDERLDIVARGIVVAGVCMSALVRAFAIAKVIGPCGLR